jgi:hypothetical protein
MITILFISNAIGADKLEDYGYQYYAAWSHPERIEVSEFWAYRSNKVSDEQVKRLLDWDKAAEFKSISPKADNAFFFKTPWPYNLMIGASNELIFIRNHNDQEAHNMVELSVNNDPSLGRFIDYGGFRSMAMNTPYLIEFDVKVNGEKWVDTIPWLLVFQGHAIPDIYDQFTKFNPPLALVVSKGRWELHIRADSRVSLPKDRSYERFEKIDLGSVEPNKWSRFGIRVMWSFEDYPNGKGSALGVWRDGKLKHQEWGRKNFFNNATPITAINLGPYLTIGAYTSALDEAHGQVKVEFDNIIMNLLEIKPNSPPEQPKITDIDKSW